MSTAALAAVPDNPDAPVDEIASLDDLRRLAAVQAAKRPRLVSIAGGGQITLAPTRQRRRRRTPEEKAIADEQAFLSSASAMKGAFDLEGFTRQVRDGRRSEGPVALIEGPTKVRKD